MFCIQALASKYGCEAAVRAVTQPNSLSCLSIEPEDQVLVDDGRKQLLELVQRVGEQVAPSISTTAKKKSTR